MIKTETVVGLGDMRVSADPEEEIICYGLGSCVGVALFDRGTGIGGLAHVVLPDSSDRPVTKPGRFANTAVPDMLRQMKELGANLNRTTARLVGGAQLAGVASGRPAFSIGPENVEATKAALIRAGVRIQAADTGGGDGRTVHFRIASGELQIHSKEKTTLL
jgi:chemotaxis protein CheD